MIDSMPAGSFEDETTFHVRRALRDDRDSLEWVVSRLTPLLLTQASYRLGSRLLGLYDAEDLVAEVWSVALGRLASIRARDGRFTPALVKFLSRTLLNRYNALLEKQIAREQLVGRAPEPSRGSLGLLERLPAETADVIQRARRDEATEHVLAAMADLDAADRAILVLRVIEQNPTAEVGRILSMKPNTVAVRFRRILEELRERLPRSIFDELGD